MVFLTVDFWLVFPSPGVEPKKLVMGFCHAGVSRGQYGLPPEYLSGKSQLLIKMHYNNIKIDSISEI